MKTADLENYNLISGGAVGFIKLRRGLIDVSGREAVQFLNGMITNDVAKLEDGGMMLAAFPNAQGRLLAVVGVLRRGERFLFMTEEATREKVFQNLFRFTFAGDFFVEDWSEKYACFSMTGDELQITGSDHFEAANRFGKDVFVPIEKAEYFSKKLETGGAVEISDELFEILRVERGLPLYGVDMDETTIVPELGIDGLISYNKGCYIGQEIIARIYFRGHVAKQLTGLVLPETVEPGGLRNAELKTADGKNAGKITSAVFSPRIGKTIALAYVRYDYLAEGTELQCGESAAIVKNLPFIG